MPSMAALVEARQKWQTVRRRPKRMPKVGENLSARVWTGKPYRSKQREIAQFTITRVAAIRILRRGWARELLSIKIDDDWLDDTSTEAFARADGFTGQISMLQAFERMGELPLHDGIVIYWK
jgi:hypothetical protein